MLNTHIHIHIGVRVILPYSKPSGASQHNKNKMQRPSIISPLPATPPSSQSLPRHQGPSTEWLLCFPVSASFSLTCFPTPSSFPPSQEPLPTLLKQSPYYFPPSYTSLFFLYSAYHPWTLNKCLVYLKIHLFIVCFPHWEVSFIPPVPWRRPSIEITAE